MAELSEIEKNGVVYALKDTHAREEVKKKLTAPNIAAVGQFLKVTEVNDKGAPVNWETVQAPGNWRIIREITLEEVCTRVDISEDADGNPFSCSKVVAYAYAYRVPDTDTEKSNAFFTFLTNNGWGTSDPYIGSAAELLPVSSGWSNSNVFSIDACGTDDFSLAVVTQPWQRYGASNFSCVKTAVASSGKYKNVNCVSFVHNLGFDVGSRFVVMGIDY